MFNQHKSVSLYEAIRFPLGVISRTWISDDFALDRLFQIVSGVNKVMLLHSCSVFIKTIYTIFE